ncbi:YafY family protein [Pseudoflavonifractor sp. MSJ-37]|uniref:helix-turn-helix transcriptional regulator n=1 Tax=Pseudoflavonifractor sp. MSJ-37 TaxID=2841531 RepID=UPI00209E3520|nr:YafY family protein [Pseudoflavonifractor sp. MSJ-37]
MSASRLFGIFYYLLSHRRTSAPELAARFEVSVRTIYRDIDALSAMGLPVYGVQGKNGGIFLLQRGLLERSAFTSAEQTQLLTALQSLPEDVRAEASGTLDKLSGLFQKEAPDWLQVDLSHWGSDTADRDKFQWIRTAILERRSLSFQYVSAHGERTQREVLPARLVFKDQAWYLQGWCLIREDYRTFKVSRILGLSVLDAVFDRVLAPPPIDGPGPSASPPRPVLLRITADMAYRVYDEFAPSDISIDPDGSFLAEIRFPEDRWLYGYLLSFGPSVEVLSPPEVRQKVCAMALDIARKAARPDGPCQGYCDKIASSRLEEASS